jgi:hypothetical protein
MSQEVILFIIELLIEGILDALLLSSLKDLNWL